MQSLVGAAFSPDGTTLAAAYGPVEIWQGILWRDPGDLRDRVCSLAVGNLTRAEWRAIAPGVPYRRAC